MNSTTLNDFEIHGFIIAVSRPFHYYLYRNTKSQGGVTLPLVSYGGSSMLSTLIMFGIIQGLYIIREDEEEEIIEKKRERANRNEPRRTAKKKPTQSKPKQQRPSGTEPERPKQKRKKPVFEEVHTIKRPPLLPSETERNGGYS